MSIYQSYLKIVNSAFVYDEAIDRSMAIINPILKNIATELRKEFPDIDDYDIIDIRDIKKAAKRNFKLANNIDRKIGNAFIRKYPNGFSIKNIASFDRDLKSFHENEKENLSLFEKYRIGSGKEIDFFLSKTNWTIHQVLFGQFDNKVFRLDLRKDILDSLLQNSKDGDMDDSFTISGDHDGVHYDIETSKKKNIEAYIKNSNHPTSKNTLTLSWVRFTMIPPGEAINNTDDYICLIDEIQTDVDDENFLGKDIMRGWEEATMGVFLKFARHKLGVKKILMPTFQTKKDKYNANPPMRLYKDLPMNFGFKNTGEFDGFMVLEV